MRNKDIRGSVSYDWKDHTELVIDNAGRWFLCRNEGMDLIPIEDVTEKLGDLDQERVSIARKYGQIDNHIKAHEARKNFLWYLRELENEAAWQQGRLNFGNATEFKRLVAKYKPIADAVWTREWHEGLEIMQEIVSRFDP